MTDKWTKDKRHEWTVESSPALLELKEECNYNSWLAISCVHRITKVKSKQYLGIGNTVQLLCNSLRKLKTVLWAVAAFLTSYYHTTTTSVPQGS